MGSGRRPARGAWRRERRWWGLLAAAWLLPAATAAAQPAEPLIREGDIEEISELDLEALLAAPTVESASKRRQSLEEAPGAITVLEGRELAEAGAVSLGDALRMVPGLWVFQTDANMFHIGVRGMAGPSTTSVLVLINGRRFDELTWGFAPWSALPLAVADIERIEVLRGPGAPLYGADALNGIVNIVTKHATEQAGVEGGLSAGTSLLPDDPAVPGGARVNNLGRGHLAIGARSDDGKWAARGSLGFGVLPEWQDFQVPAGTDFYRHGEMGYHAAVTVDWIPNRDLKVWLDARHVLTESHLLYENSPPAAVSFNEQSAVLALEQKHFLTEALTLKASADARRMNQSGRPLTLDRISAHGGGYHGLLQADLSLFDGAEILTAGVEAAHRSMGGWWTQETAARYGAVLLQNETALLDRKLVLNLAGRYEGIVSHSNTGLRAQYVNFNPRLSLIARVGRRHTVRTSLATSYRTPTTFMTFVNAVPETHPAPIPPSYATTGNPSLRPEQLRAIELGYRGRVAYWLRLDATAYVQRATDLIVHPFTTVPIQAMNWKNETHVGFDLGTQIRPSDAISGYLNYAFLYARPDKPEDAARFPPHIVSAGTTLALPHQLRLRSDFTFTAPITSTFIFTDYVTVFAHDRKRVPEQLMLNLRLGHRVEGTKTEVFIMGTNLLSPLRSRASLQQYPQAGVAPVGAVLMLGMELFPQ